MLNEQKRTQTCIYATGSIVYKLSTPLNESWKENREKLYSGIEAGCASFWGSCYCRYKRVYTRLRNYIFFPRLRVWSRSSGAWFPGHGSLDSAETGLRLPRKCSVWYGHAEGGARGDSESFHSQPGHRYETWGLRAGTEKSRGMQVQGGGTPKQILTECTQHPCVRTGKRLLAEVLDWKGPGLAGGRTELMWFHKLTQVKKDGSGRKWSSPLGTSDCSFIHSANVNSMPALCQVLCWGLANSPNFILPTTQEERRLGPFVNGS